jgi:hypothetical protein
MPSAKLYIFTEAATGIVLMTKRSLRYDFLLSLPGIESHALESTAGLGRVEAIPQTFSPYSGLSNKPPEAVPATLVLLKKKVETALFLRTACGMLSDEIRRSLSARKVKESGFRGEAFRRYFNLVTEERKIVIDRVRKFLREMEARIGDATSPDAVDHIMEHFRANVNLGVYSAANQERKKIDA